MYVANAIFQQLVVACWKMNKILSNETKSEQQKIYSMNLSKLQLSINMELRFTKYFGYNLSCRISNSCDIQIK